MRADAIDFTITGDALQMLEIELAPSATIRAEPGAMVYMTSNIDMAAGTGGGLWSGIKRKISGEGFFITTFTNKSDEIGRVGLSAPYPGHIVPLNLAMYGGSFLCQQSAFLACARGIDVSVSFVRRLGAGFFGGEGFILQKVRGDGYAFLHGGGAIIQRDLLPGDCLRVDTGCILGFSETIDYDITIVKGVISPFLAGEGFFLAELTGPGTVFLQSLPFSRLADTMLNALQPRNT